MSLLTLAAKDRYATQSVIQALSEMLVGWSKHCRLMFLLQKLKCLKLLKVTNNNLWKYEYNVSTNTRAKSASFWWSSDHMVYCQISEPSLLGALLLHYLSQQVDAERAFRELAFGPMITYLLPLLIGYNTGGQIVGDKRCRSGAIGTRCYHGAEIPMFVGKYRNQHKCDNHR